LNVVSVASGGAGFEIMRRRFPLNCARQFGGAASEALRVSGEFQILIRSCHSFTRSSALVCGPWVAAADFLRSFVVLGFLPDGFFTRLSELRRLYSKVITR
jgi:hypothetical protein